MQRVHTDAGKERFTPFDVFGIGLVTGYKFYQGQQVHRIEGMRHHQPLRVRHLGLQLTGHDAGSGRGNDGILSSGSFDLGINRTLDVGSLGY